MQIPCFNEEETLAETVADIPRRIAGVDSVEILVIDDGSSDGTVQVAREAGVDHIIQHNGNRGLAAAFTAGIDACLKRGAEIIVNTDGDNQYYGGDIAKLVAPILRGEADIVVGDRRTWTIPHFSLAKKVLQTFGTLVVRWVSGVKVADAPSGFRAISRDAALRLNLVSSFSHTIESLIQAGKKQFYVKSVPVRTNGKNRESRLFRNVPHYMTRSVTTMVRSFLMYQPLRVFTWIGAALMLAGFLPIIRFLYFFWAGDGDGHVQSLVLGGVLLLAGFLTLMIALVADLIAVNRRLLESTLERVHRLELEQNAPQAVANLSEQADRDYQTVFNSG